jgi:hypothetical protein
MEGRLCLAEINLKLAVLPTFFFLHVMYDKDEHKLFRMYNVDDIIYAQ